MSPPPPLAAAFLARFEGPAIVPPDEAALELLLTQAAEAAEARWPGVQLGRDVFARHLARHLSGSGGPVPLAHALAELSLEELYLCCACARGDGRALEELERQYLVPLPRLLSGMRQPEDVLDEVRQRLRETLLVRRADAEARIGDFGGRGALSSWLRVAATREALKVLRRRNPVRDDDVAAAVGAAPVPGVDVELDLLRRRHRPQYLEALHAAFAALEDGERHLLRLHYVDGLSTPAMAELLGRNQATVWRHLRRVQGRIHDLAKRHLKEQLQLTSGEFESLMQDLRSQLDLSIRRILGAGGPPPDSDAHSS